jgi:hypothetical protein
MKAQIETVLHSAQVYPTVGDWRYDAAGALRVYVSDMGDERYEMLVAIHELIEAFLCKQAGIHVAAVDAFDKAYERERHPGDFSEPGDHEEAPYKVQHGIASGVERLLAAHAGIDWRDYERAVNEL